MKELYSNLSLKRLFKGLFFIVFFLLISNSLWSQTYNLRFEKVSNNGTTLTVKVQMSLSSAENLGTSNLVFTYDGAEMNTPVLGTIHNFSGGNYQTMTLTSPATNTVSLNIELNTDDAGTALATGAGFTDVAEISFTLPDETGTANFQWQVATTTKTVVYQDDNSTQLSAGTLTNNDLSLDATPPSKPGTPDLATSSDSGSEEATAGATSDNLTNDLTPEITGTAEAGSTVTLTTTNGGVLSSSIAADGTTGVWTFTPGSNLNTGAHDITVTATDAAGNTSVSSSALSITIDVTQPTVTLSSTESSPTNGDNFGVIPVTFTFNSEADGMKETDITVSGTANATTGDFASTDSTTFTVNLTPGNDGTVIVDLNAGVATDLAGNANTAGNQLIITYDGTGPTVTSVSSSTANGTFGVGDDIVVTVTFSENVTVVGTPQLTLETGGTDRTINYNGTGSGTNTLQFNYTVQAGDVSTDLDYVATNSLTAGTSIKDALGNDANLTLPTPGAANSLGSNKNLVLDTAAPTVSSSSPSDDATGVDPSANITVTFNEDIEFGTGNIQLKQTSDDGVLFSIDAADPTATSNVAFISGAVLTINPGTDLSTSTGYYLSIPNTAIDDLVGNSFAGITNTTDLNFTTIVPNSAPSFTIGGNQTVSQSAGAQTIPSHSTGMTDNDGATQTLTFNVANDNNGIFDVQPDIDESSGNLTFTPKSSTFGKATVTVSLSDDGGTASGGVDQSANQTFDIFITPDNIKINEVHASAGADAEFIEVYNTGASATSLSGLVMVWFNGSDDLAYKDFDLTGSTSASGFYVIGETAFGSKDQDWGATDLQNGPDAVAIYVGSASDFTGASAPTTDGLVDVIVYGSTDDATLRTALGNPALQVAGSSTNSISRSPDGTGAFVAQAATPQATNDVTAPTVTSVSSSTADGTLKTNDCAIITVTFSEAVTVVGFPTLKLETGTTDQTINPNGDPFGSGTTTLEFLYCVGAGESSSDLEYFDVNSLTAGTSIKDAAGNDAVLTLPTIGGGNSLSDNKALVIDGVAPTVTSVSSTVSTGSYKSGDVIPVTVTFSEAVTVSGTPQIELETGTTDRTVNYSTGSGTTTLTFNYTVQAGDTNGGGLDYTSTSALTLNSGTINDAAGNAATLTLATVGAAGSISNTKSITIDTTAPTVTSVSSSTADGSYNAGDVIGVTVTFSEAVTVTGTPQLTLETGTTDRTVNYSSGSGTTTLTFDYTVQAGDTNADLDYVATNSLALNSGTINDDAGNAATLTLATPGAANSLGANKDLAIDTTAPTVTSVSSTFVSGRYQAGVVIPITVTFSEAVTVTGTPQITLETGTTDRTVNYTSGSGTTLLSFNYTVQAGDESADLDYVATNSLALNSGTINDAAANAATLTLATPAAANSLSDSKDIVIDTTAPTVSSVSSSTADGSYKAGDVIAVTVTFSENVNVTGTPQITLETGTTDRTVNYSSGSGGTTLTFNYTVQAGDESADLDYVATNSLALNSGTINDAASNAATLTLASPAATNSLGANKDLVIDTAVPTLSSVAIASSQTASEAFADASHATTGNLITLSFTASEALNGNPVVSMSVGGTGVTPAVNDLGSNNYSATYTILGTENDGAVTFTIDFTDAAGNAGTQVTAVTNSSSVEVDFVVPSLSSVTLSTNNSTDNQHGTTGDVVTLAFTANDDLSANPTVSMSVGGTGVTPTVNDLGSNMYSATYTLLGSENEGAVTFTIDFVDDAGLSGTQVTATTDASSVEADFQVPTLTTVTLASSQTASEQFVDASHAANGNTVTLDIVSSDVLSALPTVAIQSGGVNVQGPVTVAHDNPGAPDFQNFNVTYQVDGSGTTNGVDKDADGTVTFTIDFTDDVGIAGTQVTATTNSSAVEVDNVAPTLTSVAIASSQTASEAFADASHATTGNLVTVSFTSDDDLSANPVVSMSVGGTGVTPTVNDLGSNNYSATYTILGTENDGAVTFTIDFTDDAGNAGTQVTAVTNSSSVEVDFVAPTLSPVTLSTNNSTDNQHGTTGNVVTLAFTSTDDLSADPTVSMSVGGTGVTPTVNDLGSNMYSATYTLLGSENEGAVTFTIDFVDDAGISGTQVTATTDASSVEADFQAPTLTTVTLISNNGTNNQQATDGNTVLLDIVSSDVLSALPTVAIQSGGVNVQGPVTVAHDNPGAPDFQNFNVTYAVDGTGTTAGTDKDGEGALAFTIDFTDDAGIAGTQVTATTNSSTMNIDFTGPTVTSVSSSIADGTYKAGDVIAVTVTFSESVTVTGTPQIELETGTTDRTVNYSSGSPGTTLTFNYTVQAGDLSSDLDYTSDGALTLNGGTINDGAGNAATLTLATEGTAGSLGANKALMIDTSAPTISSTSPTDDATDVGISSDITITFSENIAFGTGNIQIIDLGDNSSTVIIDVASPGSEASISGAMLTLSPSSALELNTNYAVQIASTAIDDLAGNDFAGITDNTTFNFTTVNTSVAFSATSSNAAESTASADLEVTLNAISGVNVTVDYAVTGTATGSGTDYTLANGTLTINAGSLTNNISIASIIDDALDEAEETVIVTLSNPTNAGLGTNMQHTYTINDDDPTPVVSLSQSNPTFAEAGGTNTITATASAATGRGDITVNIAVKAGGTTATVTDDYTLSSATITITEGTTTGTATLTAVQDALDESNETITVEITGTINADEDGTQEVASSITDDDAAPSISFNTTASDGAEATANANLQVDLSAVSGQDVMVDYAVTGTATEGTDFTLADGTLTISAGSSIDNITIASIVSNAIDEDDETVIVTLSNPVNATLGTNTVHTYTILDDDASPTISFTTSSGNGAESVSSKDVQVDLSTVSDRTITADYTVTGTASNGTDYTLADGALTFTAGDNSETITIASIDDDAILESNETVIITLSNLVNVSAGTNQQFTYTIFDNDAAAVTIADVSQAENGGDITVTATLDNAVEGGFTVDVNTADGTAETTDSDYTAVTSETLTFTGTAGETQTFTVTPTADTRLEADETLTVSMDNLAATSLSIDISDGATVTINNDDNAAVTIEDVTGTENGGAILLTATLDNAVQGGFSVDVITTDNTATTADSDYTALNVTTLTFTGNAGETQQFTVTPTADTKVEANEDLFIGMQNTQGTSHSINIGDGASVTIINDDAATIAINDVTRAENADGGATTTYTFTATLTGDVDQSISVDYATQDGTATTADNDYTAASGTLTFDGINGETETFQVIVGNDDKVELDETFSALLSNRQVGGKNVTLSDASGTGTITNDDAAAVTIADISGAENGGDITVTATLDKAVEGGFTVDVSTADGTAETGDSDYTAVTSETLTFAGAVGETQTFTVSPTADTKFETDETLTVAMSNLVAVNAAVSAIDITDGATVTIDNDDTEPTVTLSVDDNSIAENGGTATLTATLSNLSVNDVDVTIGYAGTADNGTDYNNTASTTITVSGGTMSASAAVIITATDDATAEGDETIITTIDGVTNGTEDGTQSQTITIEDDDAAIITSVTSNTVNGSYKAGDLIEVLVTFNRAVNVTGTPQLTLETGTTDQTANYASGDGTTTLTFNYTVQAGDVSSDLDYTGTTALALNGGTIIGNGLNAILDLPAPGATNSLGDNAAIVIDTDAPTDPVVTVPATDILLNAATQTVSGTHGEDGITINLYADSDNNGVADNATVLTSTTVSGNAWSLTANLTGDAANNFVVQAADAAGNTSAQVDVPTITEDSISPVITSDGGAATASLNVNENNTAVTTVTATDANPITFTISGGADQALFSIASGVLTFTAAPDFENPGDLDTDNAYVVEVTASDGVNTDDTQTITVTVVDLDDNSPVITSDGGAATAAVNVNENATAVTTVTATDADGVSTIAYSISGGADQALFSMASGVLTFTAAPDFENPGDADTDNAYVVEVTATDGTTTADTQTITVTVVDLNDNNPVITASQTLSVDETASNSTSVGTVVATDPDAGTTFSSWAITAGNGSGIFAINAGTGEVTIADNTNLSPKDVTASYTLTLTVSDGANTSATETITINILDTTAPAAPVVTGISDDTGSSSTDGITSDRNLLINGTAESNANVEVFSGAASVGTVQADVNGDWTLDITGFTLNESVSNVTAEAEDASGNRSTASAVFVLTIDFTAPAKPAVTHISDDTGSSSTDGITSDRNLLVHGTAEANSSVEVFSGVVSVGTVQTDGNGDWTLDITAFTLTQSVSNVTAEAEDAAGNRSATSDIFVLTIDFSAPAKPVIASISDDTGSSTTDGVTSDNTLSFTGTAEANSTVEVFIDGSSIGTTTVDGSGDFTYDHTATTLTDGTISVTAMATDAAGNQSASSDAFSVTIDTVVPAKAVFTGISDDNGISNTDFTTNDGTLIFSGTAEPFSTIALKSGPFTLTTTTADMNGDWMADITNRPFTSGFTAIATSTDPAGNVSADSDPLVIVIDVVDPTVSSINRVDPSPTMATSVDYTVTFDEEVHGLSTSSFGLAFTGTQNASIASISATSGTSITVTVNNITGEGTFGLNLTSTTGITDVAGNSLAGTFTGQLYTTNSTPTDITLSSTSILENNSIGDAVGTLGSSDIDAGDTHTYTLVAGTGDADNASFSINGTQLEAAAVFDLETKASYNIRLQTDDGNGGTFQKAFTITIDNVPEADLRITGNNNIPATPLGITTSFDITIHNDGDAAMSVTSILYPTAFGGPVSGINIAAASSQVVTMTFTPTVAQLYTGDITIVTNGGTGILAVSADGAIITGTDDGLLTAEAINIYPNPASDVVTVDLSEFNGRPLDIQLFDLSGTKTFGVADFREATLKLDIKAYQQGIYLMYFTDGKSTVQKKFMIRK